MLSIVVLGSLFLKPPESEEFIIPIRVIYLDTDTIYECEKEKVLVKLKQGVEVTNIILKQLNTKLQVVDSPITSWENSYNLQQIYSYDIYRYLSIEADYKPKFLNLYIVSNTSVNEDGSIITGLTSLGGLDRIENARNNSIFILTSYLDTNTLAHEFGHYLGLVHSEDETNIMYPVGCRNFKFSKTQINKAKIILSKKYKFYNL
jgi:hypothetical protein